MINTVFFLIRARDAFRFFDRCIDSIFSQNNKNYSIIYIDDASPLSLSQKKYIQKKLRGHVVQINTKRKYSVRNAFEALHRYVPDNAVVVSLDGDDWLLRPDVVDIILQRYNTTQCDVTYGNCLYYAPGTSLHNKILTDVHPFANTRYPVWVDQNRSFRRVPFRAFHLRTWKATSFKALDRSKFLFPDGTWLRYCEDQAILYALLERHAQYEVIDTPLSAYNISAANHDEHIHLKDKLIDEVAIRRMNRNASMEIVQDEKENAGKSDALLIYRRSDSAGPAGVIEYMNAMVRVLIAPDSPVPFRNEDRLLERLLARLIGVRYKRCRVTSTKIGYSLSYIPTPIRLHLDHFDELKIRVLSDYENCMWTLSYIRSLDQRTYRNILKSGIPLSKLSVRE